MQLDFPPKRKEARADNEDKGMTGNMPSAADDMDDSSIPF